MFENATSYQKWGSGLTATGGLFSAFGQYQQGQFQGDLGDFNARQSRIDAQISIMNADEQAKYIRRQGRALIGTQRTRYAKAGVRMSGTPLEVMADTIEAYELDAINVRLRGRFQAAQSRIQGKFQKQQAGRSRIAGGIGAFGSLLNSGTRISEFFA